MVTTLAAHLRILSGVTRLLSEFYSVFLPRLRPPLLLTDVKSLSEARVVLPEVVEVLLKNMASWKVH